MATMESMRASLERWILEPVDSDMATESINDAIQSLWKSLIEANVGDYISRQPERLTEDESLIPFDEISASEEFIRWYALSQICIPIREYDQAKIWAEKAEGKRREVILEVLQKSPRQESITAYQPYDGVTRQI